MVIDADGPDTVLLCCELVIGTDGVCLPTCTIVRDHGAIATAVAFLGFYGYIVLFNGVDFERVTYLILACAF